jgi:VanZ family protein
MVVGMRRVSTVLLSVLVAVVVGWLSLSSGGFGVVGEAADGATAVVGEVEQRVDRDLVQRSDIPWAADEVAHLLGWGAVTLGAGVAFRSSRSLTDIAVGVFLASVFVEFLQGWFVAGRNAQAHDLSANSLGVMSALVVLAAAERVWPARRPVSDRTPVAARR